MFNRTLAVIAPERHVTEHVHVTHRHAPTHESVRLLTEMEQAARDKIEASIKVGDTAFECVVHVLFDHASGDRIFKAVFSLGGVKMRVEHRVNAYRDADVGKDDGIIGLRDMMAREIASAILDRAAVPALRGWCV